MKIALVVGTRPNFIKIAPLITALKKSKFTSVLIHTGQHYDASMSDIFFSDLQVAAPDFDLGIQGEDAISQIGQLVTSLSAVFKQTDCESVLVVGDSNPSVGAAIAAKHLGKYLIHVEAGLRSFDLSMPEEINRMLTDAVSDCFFVSEESGMKNLLSASKNNVHFVGNVMIDTLCSNIVKVEKTPNPYSYKDYALLTLHRVSNVDDINKLQQLIDIINNLAKEQIIVFPIHPRTETQLKENNIKLHSNIIKIAPQGYLAFHKLLSKSRFVLTDSGGIQEESTYWKIPCLTLRNNTERPITCNIGSNTLVGADEKLIRSKVYEIMHNTYKKGSIPPLWDGKTSERIVNILENLL
jgi:UDP-N-acetylglucosamine 2-epimerase (non-hydrolysing)